MKNFKIINVLLLAIGVIAAPTGANAASLLEVYQQALQSDPQIHEAEARRLAALEAEPQARGVLLPQVNLNGGWTKIDSSGSSFSLGLNRTVDVTQETDRQGFTAELRQTVFRWDQVVNLRRADKIVTKAEALREAAQQDLIIRVAQRYFDVLAAEDRLTSIHADRTAIARQLEQAKQRFEVGLIAITDVQESQAAYDQSVASEIGAKRELATARNLLREITGEYTRNLSAPVEEFPLILPEKSERDWVDMSLNQNLNLIASRMDEKLARDEISFQKTGHYPTLELVARADKQINDGDGTNDGAPSIIDSDFDTNTISLQFTIPIFAGGGTSSRVREAVYLHRASREQLQRVTRETERQSRDAYLGVLAEQSRVQALAQAVASSQTALEATQAGFDVGTRTIVDVLNSQFSLYVAITNHYQSRYDYILNVLRLKEAAGTLQVQDLEQIDQWLIDRKPPEEVIAEEEAKASGT
ncbi:MAG: TolC family outer membrane protein [Gammaproteobacteria bacterium]|jgi:outer membrane protein|nr:TolC family outer membrane protein [Gammaproteobacteria bacterium]